VIAAYRPDPSRNKAPKQLIQLGFIVGSQTPGTLAHGMQLIWHETRQVGSSKRTLLEARNKTVRNAILEFRRHK
jgi:hypothetical protein